MPDVEITATRGAMPTHLAVPDGDGPWPGVIVLHDALGVTSDLREQAAWLAGAGFLAAAPDLYYWGGRLTCVRRVMADLARGRGDVFADVAALRDELVVDERCTGRVGVIGFCMGGGFALLLALGEGYHASSVNYGALPKDLDERLAAGGACPVVASFGGRDLTLRGAAARLDESLAAAGVEHDVREYPEAGHGFLNDHDDDEMPRAVALFGAIARTGHHPQAAVHARQRIVGFFERHLA